jgi:hypothetical protein
MKKYAFVALIFLFAAAAQAQTRPPQYPIKAYDGETIANFDVGAALIAHLDELPGKVAVGNLHGDVTLYQFGSKSWQSIIFALGPAVFDQQVLSLRISG